MLKKYVFASVIVLGACSTFVDKAIQDIAFTTPGAHNTICNVHIDNLRYKVRPPQTITINKSKENMEVECLAPGNRRKKIYIEPEISDTSAWNLATAGVGYPYDYASGALFKYPSHITVDFTNTMTTDMPLPAQNQPDIRQPEDYDLEEFSPGTPRLNDDRNAPQTQILRRGQIGFGDSYGDDYAGAAFSEMPADGKGDLIEVIPAGATHYQQPVAEPTPLIPGE